MKNIRVYRENGSYCLDAPDYITNIVLAANTPQLLSIPSNATHAFISSDQAFWTSYVHKALSSGGTDELNDLVTNGAYATDTDWTRGTGWTIGSGVASSDGTQSADSDLEQDPAIMVENQAYWVTFTVSNHSAGNITPVVGGTEGTDRTANGTYTEYVVAGSGDAIALRADLDFVGDVDDFSIVPAAQIPSSNDTNGRASELSPTQRYVGNVSDISFVSDAATKISIAFFRS